MSTADCTPLQLNLNDSLGATFLGNLAAAILFGITSVQTYLYYDRSQMDSKLLKKLVAVLWVLDAIHLAFVTHTTYTYAVLNFGNPAALAEFSWSFQGNVAVTVISDVIVRGIFTYRIWRLNTRRWYMAAAITVFSLVHTVGGLIIIGAGAHSNTYAEIRKFSATMYMSFSGEAVADILIAGTLCFLLARRRSTFRKTDSVIRTLMLYAISTGAFTSFMEIAVLITFGVWPNSLVCFAFYYNLPKLLLNALLASLNARQKLREKGDIVTIPLGPVSMDSHTAAEDVASAHGNTKQDHIEIQVDRMTSTETDSSPYISETQKSYSLGT